jgi:NitT/TauT family transport system permease protein/taurine transport system permease protein
VTVRLLVKGAITLAVLGLWQALPSLGIVHPIVLAPPSAVVAAAIKDWPVFLDGLRITMLEALTAVALAWAVGLGVGVALGSSARLAGFAVPPLESAFAMPWVVLYPLLILWLGIGSPSKVLFATVSATFPILLTTIAAVSTVDTRCLLLARALKASRLQTYVKILVPFALPQILGGLRLGTAVAVIAVLVGEMLTSVGGLGFVITYNRTQFETGHVYFGLVLAITMALGANWLMGLVERRLAWWAETTK